MTAYYNEIDKYAAQWLRNLINAGHIAPGIVDEPKCKGTNGTDRYRKFQRREKQAPHDAV